MSPWIPVHMMATMNAVICEETVALQPMAHLCSKFYSDAQYHLP